jgi:hypothetical protein
MSAGASEPAQGETMMLANRLESLGRQVEAVTGHLVRVRERSVVLNDELWYWAQYRAKQLGKASVSEYLFDLIREDEKKGKS